ncbi:DUF6861 domain-containing protein [Selenomonas ruminantium]|uniref:Uncharacterized protein n=1 Tax=Selenomonas ruminantium TaxID=971 RepID=A0A1I0VI07_SELRU|nr:hypothetical protein [Selenomonas ruminantium]SFA75838.1 hypothetical protein SAMN05216587_101624 [Selenomonas ruminantium]
MAIIAAPDGSFYSNKTGKTYTREEVLAKLEAKKAEDNKSIFEKVAETAGSIFSGEPTTYDQAGAIQNAVQGNGRGVDAGEVKRLQDANAILETDSDRAARLREASNILGLDEVQGNTLLQGGLTDDSVMKSALALAKKKQESPDDWEQFAADHPATVKYLEQQKNMAISYDDVKPLGRLEDTANQVKTHLEMMDVEEKIAELGRKYDAANMSYNELSADQRVELNDLLTKRKDLAGNIDTWSIGNVLGGLLAMKEDLPMAIAMGLQTGAVGAGAGAMAGGIGAIPGAMSGFGIGFRIGMGASMGYRMAGTQYAENMMRADANGQYMDAHSLRQGAWGAGLGMTVLGTVGVGRLTSKLPMGQVYDKFLRTTSPSVLNNPAAREAAWKGYLSTLGVGLKEAAIQDVIFGGGTSALTYGANRYSEALSGLDYSNREDGTLIENIVNGMKQFAPMALATGVGFSVAGKMASNAMGKKNNNPPMPVADGLNKTMDAVNETKTAQRSPQATREAVNTIFGENASAQDVEINARGLVRLCQEADPENPNLAAEVAQKLGVDAEMLNKAVELDDTVKVSVTDFVTEMKDSNLRQEMLKEVKDVDGMTENARGEMLTYAQKQWEQAIEFVQEAGNAKYDHNDPAWIAAMDISKKAYPKQPVNAEKSANLIYAGFKQQEERGILQLNGFANAEQAIRALDVRRVDAPRENNNINLNQVNENNIDKTLAFGDNIAKELFSTHLNDGIMDIVKGNVAKHIEQAISEGKIDLSKMADSVEREKARENIPYIKIMNERFNTRYVQKEHPEYQDRLAAKIEYARRCFDNDERINEYGNVRQMDGNDGQRGVREAGTSTIPNGNEGGVGEGLRQVDGNYANGVGAERGLARKHYEKLYSDIKQKHSDEQGAFRLQQTDERAAADVANTTVQELFQKAWVGSPADFNKFDLGYVGTGEGAQIHGYGLYSAKDRGVAERYKETISSYYSDDYIMFGDKRLPAFGFVDGLTTAETMAYKNIQRYGYHKERAVEHLREYLKEQEEKEDIALVKEAIAVAEKAEVHYNENKGKLYEVEVPDNDVLLDEQKPFSEQPEKVQAALKKLANDLESGKIDVEDSLFISSIRNATKRGKSTGQDIYHNLSVVMGGDKAASELLNRYDIKGITYEGGMDGRCYVVFDDKAMEIINKYNQEAGKQGNILASYMPQEQGRAIIELYKNANPSSLAHEMLHHFVFLHENAYKTGKMEGQVLQDFQKLAEFAGHELGTEWSREEHEKLASAWETYLSEGKAPSLELVGTFERFKNWMKRIYQTLVRHSIPINDDVRGVFDRMLASDKELEMAQAFYESEPLFAGREMGAAELREYAALVNASHKEAQREMDKRVMAEVNPAMKEIRDNVAANLREDIAGKMMMEPVYAARALFTAPLESADFKAAKADAIKAKIEERLDLLVKQSALGIEKRGEVVSEHGTVTENWFVGDSMNHDWYREMFKRKGGKIPASWYRFINAYKNGEKTLKQMPKTMREEYEYIANEQLTHGHKDSFLGDIPEDIEFVNLKENSPAMSWIVQNGGGIRLDRQSVYERFGQGTLPERWLTDKNGFTIDEVADYVYDGNGSGDMLFNELTTKPTFSKELNKRVQAGMAEFKEQEYGTLRESAIKAVHNEKSLEAICVDLEIFEKNAAEFKSKQEQETADAIAEGREKSKWENKIADAKEQGKEAVADQKLADSIYYGGKMAKQKRKADEKLDEQKAKAAERLEAQKAKDAEKLNSAKEKAEAKVAREQRWLDAAVMRGQVRAKMARAMAKEQLANTPVGEVMKWQKYAALAKKAGDEAVRLMSKGDYEGAIEAKNREITCHALAREAGKIDTEINRDMRYFARINKRGNNMKNVPHEFNVQIDNLLAKYNLLTREPLKPLEGDKSLQTFINDCQEDYFTPQVADFVINGQPQHYTRLTVNELRDLKSSVESIRHVGRQMDALVANEKKQRISDIAASMVEQLSTHEKKYSLEGEMGAYDKTPLSVTSLVKAETLLRLMDKGEENGVFVSNLYNPIKLGLDDMANRSRKIIADVDKLLADTGWTKAELSKLKDQEHTFDFMPNPKITHEQVLHAALNWGNEGNRDRLRYYFMSPEERKRGSWAPEETAELDAKVMQMFEVLTEKDLKLVQGIWDYLETYAPEIRKHEVDCAGVDPKMVEATAFSVMTADGKVVNLKGGYYPIRYDSGKSVRAMDLAEANELFKKNSAVAASVAHGHTENRVNHMNRPLLLDWSTFTDHLRNVNYDLAMRKPIMDVSRLLRRDDVQSAIAETFGNDNLRMLQTWLRDVATDQREALTFTEKAMRWTRTRVSVAFLGFRTKALFIDLPQNFITASWQNGIDNVIKGTAQFYLTGDYREKIAFVNQRSPMMRDKFSFMDANLADLRTDLMDGSTGARLTRTAQKLAFCCDAFSDNAVNYPTWIQYHAEAMARGLDDAAASLEADARVRRQSVDTSKAGMAAVQRGGEGRKLLTPFYSYFSAYFNRLYYDYNLAQIKWADGQQMDAAGLMVRTAVLGVGIPTMIEAIMQGVVLNNDREKDKKKREENMYKEMASSSFSYLANTIPVAGAVASFSFNKAIGKKYSNYELSPVEGAIENLFSVPAAVVNYVAAEKNDKEAGRKLAESVAKAAAIGAPYPNMLNTLALNIWDVMTQSGDFTLADIVTRRRNQK